MSVARVTRSRSLHLCVEVQDTGITDTQTFVFGHIQSSQLARFTAALAHIWTEVLSSERCPECSQKSGLDHLPSHESSTCC